MLSKMICYLFMISTAEIRNDIAENRADSYQSTRLFFLVDWHIQCSLALTTSGACLIFCYQQLYRCFIHGLIRLQQLFPFSEINVHPPFLFSVMNNAVRRLKPHSS